MSTRTNIVLDDELVAKAMSRAHVSTKKAAVEAALRAFVREPDWSALLALEGSRLIADDYDPDGGALNATTHMYPRPAPSVPLYVSDNVRSGLRKSSTPAAAKRRKKSA
jgi:hypothetical protein